MIIIKNVKDAGFLGKEKISRLLINQSIPGSIGQITIYIHGFVEAVFLGRLGITALAAIAVITPLKTIARSFSSLFGPPAGAYISRLLGAGKNEEADRVATMAIASTYITSAVMVFIFYLSGNKLLPLIGAAEKILSATKEYYNIYILGIPLLCTNVVYNNYLRAEGNPCLAMISRIISSLANIFLALLFIFGFGWGMKGAALATVFAAIIEGTIVSYHFFAGKSYLKLRWKYVRIYREEMFTLIKLGLPVMISNVFLGFTSGIINNFAATFGTEAIAAAGIVNHLRQLPQKIMIGFNHGFRSVVSYNTGAKRYNRVIEAIKLSIKYRFLTSSVFSIIIIILANPIIRLFTTNPQINFYARFGVIAVFIASPVALSFQILSEQYFLSIGKTVYSSIIKLANNVLFPLPLLIILSNYLGIKGVFLSRPIAMFFAGLLGIGLGIDHIGKLKKEVVETKKPLSITYENVTKNE